DTADKPVTLPPGRARLTAMPSGKRVSHRRSDNWDYRGRLLCGNGGWSSPGHDDTDLEVDKLGRNLGQTLVVSLRPPILDDDVAAVDPAELAKPLHESGDPLALGRTRARTQEPDSVRRLLRVRRYRTNRCAARDRDELAPLELTDLHA